MHKINTTTKKFTEAVTIDLGQLPTVDTRIDFILTDGTNPVIAENKTFAMTIGTVQGELYKTDDDTVSFRYLKFNDDNVADSLAITMKMNGEEILNDTVSLTYQTSGGIDASALDKKLDAPAVAGTVGQVLTKTADGQEWADAPAGGGGKDTTDYLCFEATGVTHVRLDKYYDPDPIDMEYSTDKKTWIPYTWDSVKGSWGLYKGAEITLKLGDKIWWRGNNDHFSKGLVGNYFHIYKFITDGNVRVSGVLMSLLDKTCNSVTIPTSYCFAGLFSGKYTFTSDFKIQALYYKPHCFESMFSSSGTYFEKIPVFKGEVQQNCFSRLFADSNIKNIDLTDVFPKMEVSDNTDCSLACYEIFRGCTMLKHIKVNFNNWFSRDQFSQWLKNASSTGVIECPSALDCSTRDASHVPAGWTIVRTDSPKSITSPTTASSEATYKVSPNTPSVPVVTVSSALTLNTSTVDSGSVAYAEIVLDVATGATVTAGTNITLVDTPTAGKRNICVCRWSGGVCKLYVTIVEDLPQA